jgi:hypothetical protein
VNRGRFSRRQWLRRTSGLAAGLPLSALPFSKLYAAEVFQDSKPQAPQNVTPPPPNGAASLFNGDPTKYRFTREEDRFLEEIERASFQFFWDEANPYTGLVKDRSQAGGPDSRNVASIAATGFGLTGLCIADHRGWEDKKKIRDRVRNTLRFVESRVPQAHGFFCHFLNVQNGERVFQSEVSSIDTAIFVCGVLTCRAYFDDAELAASWLQGVVDGLDAGAQLHRYPLGQLLRIDDDLFAGDGFLLGKWHTQGKLGRLDANLL